MVSRKCPPKLGMSLYQILENPNMFSPYGYLLKSLITCNYVKIQSNSKKSQKLKHFEKKSTKEADLERVAKAKRWSGLMESLAWMNMRIACLMESNLVSGRPFEPVLFISTRDSTSTSTHSNMSSLHIREGFNVYLLLTSELSPCTTTSISLSLSLSALVDWSLSILKMTSFCFAFGWWYKRCVFSSFHYLHFVFFSFSRY